MKYLFLFASFLLGLFPLFIHAAAIQVTPTRINLDNNAAIATLGLSNKASTPSMIQIQITHWTQTGDQDVYVPSTDLIVSPPIMSIAPGKSQLIRIALRKNSEQRNEEDAYRIYVQEIPKYHPANMPGVAFALRFGIPIFIAPTVAVKHVLEWKTEKLANNNLQLLVMNSSNTHVQFTHLTLMDASTHKSLISQDVFVYLLPHQSKEWLFKLSSNPGQNIEVHAISDWGILLAKINA